jgi:hypothetical protein
MGINVIACVQTNVEIDARVGEQIKDRRSLGTHPNPIVRTLSRNSRPCYPQPIRRSEDDARGALGIVTVADLGESLKEQRQLSKIHLQLIRMYVRNPA